MFCRPFPRALLRWLVFASLAAPLAAGEIRSSGPVGAFSLRRWTTEDGLPKNTVTSLLQTHDGYLWVGTRHGLARFDGVRFKVFTDELAIEEGGDLSCYDLGEDTIGRLWVRLPAGFVCYHHGRFQKFPTWLGALPSRQGGLWVVTRDGLSRYEDGDYTPVPQAASWPPERLAVATLQEDREGRLWVGFPSALNGVPRSWQRLDPRRGKVESVVEIVGEPIADVTELNSDRAGRLWLGTRDELLCWDEGKLSRFSNSGAWRRNDGVGQMITAGRATLWFAPPLTRKLVRFQGGQFDSFGVEDGLADTDFRSLLWDREGNLWVGMGAGGLQRLRPRALTSLLTTNAVGDRKQIDSVCSGRRDAVWLGTWNGLLRWEGGFSIQFTNAYNPSRPFLNPNARPVLEDGTGQVWFGSENNGLFKLVTDQAVRVTAADEGRTNWIVRVLHEDRTGRLWIGSDSGLLERRGNRFVRYTTRDGLSDDTILGIRDAPDGSLWVGTPKGLHHFRDGRFRALTTHDGLLHNQVNPLLVEEDGTVWAGTPQGLNRIRGEEIRAVTERQGLYDNALFCLLDDGAGHFWANSVRGIFRIRKTDLHAVADGREERLYCVSYGEADGAASAEGSGDYQPSACRTPDGRMWFPTTRGVVVLDPAALVEREVPPLVVIEEVLANNQLVFADGGPTALGSPMRETTSSMRLPAGRADGLEIRYTANSFVAPEKVQFRYRLEGADAQWRSAGTRRVAFYTNLRPRSYRFRVEASNREGTWSEQPAVFAFSIAPHYWETWPFYASCVVVVLVGGGVVQAYRLRWQRRLLKLEEQQALANERGRIAKDLHDDLGANLTGLALQLDVLRGQSHASPDLQTQLGTIARSTRGLVDTMREVIWVVNPQHDDVESLAGFLGQYTETYLAAAGLRCRLELPARMPAQPLTADARHQLLLVVKEALHNVVRHAQASEVQLSVQYEVGELRLVIDDDGRGLAEGRARVPGHGLDNMEKRVRSLGGRFSIARGSDRGTRITIGIPLPHANPPMAPRA